MGTNLEMKEIQLLNKNDSLNNEIAFLRNENKKYLLNIGSLQKKLSVSNQELKDTKQEIVKKYELDELNELNELNKIKTETKTKSVQTKSIENGKDEKDEKDEKEEKKE